MRSGWLSPLWIRSMFLSGVAVPELAWEVWGQTKRMMPGRSDKRCVNVVFERPFPFANTSIGA